MWGGSIRVFLIFFQPPISTQQQLGYVCKRVWDVWILMVTKFLQGEERRVNL